MAVCCAGAGLPGLRTGIDTRLPSSRCASFCTPLNSDLLSRPEAPIGSVLLMAAGYVDSKNSSFFLNRAKEFYYGALRQLLEFDTCTLTRPLALVMLNIMSPWYYIKHKNPIAVASVKRLAKVKPRPSLQVKIITKIMTLSAAYSVKAEMELIRSRLRMLKSI